MSTNKYSYMPKLTQPVLHVGAKGSIQAHIPAWLQGASAWLAHRRVEEDRLNAGVDYELGDERHTEDGYYRVSPGQATLERMIELNWVHLRMKRNS